MMARLKELWKEEKSTFLLAISMYIGLSTLLSIVICIIRASGSGGITLEFIFTNVLTAFVILAAITGVSILVMLFIYVVYATLSKLFS